MKLDPLKLCQIELHVADVEESLKFYEQVFGWRRLPCDILDYHVLEVPEHCSFGISLVPGAKKSVETTACRQVLYFAVEDLEAMTSKVELAGGQLRGKSRPVPRVGLVTQVVDPNGLRFGLVEKKPAE